MYMYIYIYIYVYYVYRLQTHIYIIYEIYKHTTYTYIYTYVYIYIYINTHICIYIQVTLTLKLTFYSCFKEFSSDEYYIYVHIYKLYILYIIKSSHDSKTQKICNISVSKTALSIVYAWSQATGVKQLLCWLVYIYTIYMLNFYASYIKNFRKIYIYI